VAGCKSPKISPYIVCPESNQAAKIGSSALVYISGHSAIKYSAGMHKMYLVFNRL
jgi:hypothetical protein